MTISLIAYSELERAPLGEERRRIQGYAINNGTVWIRTLKESLYQNEEQRRREAGMVFPTLGDLGLGTPVQDLGDVSLLPREVRSILELSEKGSSWTGTYDLRPGMFFHKAQYYAKVLDERGTLEVGVSQASEDPYSAERVGVHMYISSEDFYLVTRESLEKLRRDGMEIPPVFGVINREL